MSEELQNRIVARIVRCCGEKILKPRWRPNEYVLIVEIKKNHLHSGAQMEVEQHLAGAYWTNFMFLSPISGDFSFVLK